MVLASSTSSSVSGSGFQVFYMRDGEVHEYLSCPTTQDTAFAKSDEFDSMYYNKPAFKGRGLYGVSRSWVGRV